MTLTSPTTPLRPQWLLQILAVVGIAVGIFIIAAGVYLLIFPPPCCAGM